MGFFVFLFLFYFHAYQKKNTGGRRAHTVDTVRSARAPVLEAAVDLDNDHDVDNDNVLMSDAAAMEGHVRRPVRAAVIVDTSALSVPEPEGVCGRGCAAGGRVVF